MVSVYFVMFLLGFYREEDDGEEDLKFFLLLKRVD